MVTREARDELVGKIDEKIGELLSVLTDDYAARPAEQQTAAIRNLAEARAWIESPGQPHGEFASS